MADKKSPRMQSFAGRSPEDADQKQKGIAARFKGYYLDSGDEEALLTAGFLESADQQPMEMLVHVSARSVALVSDRERSRRGGKVKSESQGAIRILRNRCMKSFADYEREKNSSAVPKQIINDAMAVLDTTRIRFHREAHGGGRHIAEMELPELGEIPIRLDKQQLVEWLLRIAHAQRSTDGRYVVNPDDLLTLGKSSLYKII